jgi:hypothetical protein
VIFLPFLLMLFSAVVLTGKRYDAVQVALSHARSCAWLYSQRGCDGNLPAECGAQAVAAESPVSALSDVAQFNPINDDDKLSPRVNTTLGAPSTTLFGEYTNVTGSVSFSAPKPFGGKRTISTSYHLACNLKPKTLGGIISDFIGSVLP